MHIVLAVVVSFLAVMFGIMWVLKNQIYVVAPNQLLVIAGRAVRAGDRLLGYRTVRGGRAVRVPLIERVEWLDLTDITIALDSFEVLTSKGLPVRLNWVATVRIAAAQPQVDRALESLLGKSRDEIAALARQVIIGVLVGHGAGIVPEHFATDCARLAELMSEEAAAKLHRLGLELDRLQITPDGDDRYFATLADGARAR